MPKWQSKKSLELPIADVYNQRNCITFGGLQLMTRIDSLFLGDTQKNSILRTEKGLNKVASEPDRLDSSKAEPDSDLFKETPIKEAIEVLRREFGLVGGERIDVVFEKLSAKVDGVLKTGVGAFSNGRSSKENSPVRANEAEFKMGLRINLSSKDLAILLLLSQGSIDDAVDAGFNKYRELEMQNENLPTGSKMQFEDIMLLVEMTMIAELMGIDQELKENEADSTETLKERLKDLIVLKDSDAIEISLSTTSIELSSTHHHAKVVVDLV